MVRFVRQGVAGDDAQRQWGSAAAGQQIIDSGWFGGDPVSTQPCGEQGAGLDVGQDAHG
jgi:hypothetical protein